MEKRDKDTLLRFMGQVYGETKKQDQMLVGQSNNLRPKSEQIRQQFEQVLRSEAVDSPAQPQVQQSVPVVTPEAAAQELVQAQVVVPEPVQTVVDQPNDPNQLEFDLSEPSKIDKVIELLEKQNKILLEIRDNSIKSKSNAKRAKNTKPQ